MENSKKAEEQILNPILKNKMVAWLLLGTSFLLMLIDNFFKMNLLVGGWHMVLYVLLQVPLAYMLWNNALKNPYTKWFIPVLFILMIDMFLYSNKMTQYVVPILFYLLLGLLYLSSMQKVDSLYQVLTPRSLLSLLLPLKVSTYLRSFLENLFLKHSDKQLYSRIAMALAITLPFLVLFLGLLFSADAQFQTFLSDAFSFDFNFSIKYIVTTPLYFFLYLIFFLYAFSNTQEHPQSKEPKALDMLIVGIFLGMINLLFALFILLQLPFLFGANFLPEGLDLATFAREGFFQLMIVMGIVLLIFLFIMRRFKGEKLSIVLLSFLLFQTIVMGIVSIKKMYLYQSIKGATVLRYYVEWFDYFLIAVLTLGIYFLIKKLKFAKLLDVVAILGVVSFTIIVSLNIDAMVASHNIQKFKSNSQNLDKYTLRSLSIDALPVIEKNDINLTIPYQDKGYLPWYKETLRKECSSFATYHYGYCSKLKNHKEN